MKKGQWFMNDETGVITNIHREAVEWYRQGQMSQSGSTAWLYSVGVIDKKGECKNACYC